MARAGPFSLLFPGQTIDATRKVAAVAMCASMDGEWMFVATGNGMIKVFKRGKTKKARREKARKQGMVRLGPHGG